MLVCVTSILMAALCGPLLPDGLSSISPGRINCASKKAGVRWADSHFEPLAPPGGPSTRPADPMLPGWYRQQPWRDSRWPNEQPKLGNQWAKSSVTDALASSPGRPQVLAVNAEACATPATKTSGAESNVFGSNGLQQASQPVTVGSCCGGQSSQFEDIHSQLQRLGVTYYVLERQHWQRPLYRFYCRLSEADEGGDYGRFEAVDEDPVRAMWRVLLEVERYRCGRELAATPASAY